MTLRPSRNALETQPPTHEEIDQAIADLTPAQLLRLKKFARWRIRGLGRANLGRDFQDLLQEAITSTIAGTGTTREGRHWNKKVDFVKHITEAMRSISSHWKVQFDEQEAQLESDVKIVAPDGTTISPLDYAVSNEPAADRVLSAK